MCRLSTEVYKFFIMHQSTQTVSIYQKSKKKYHTNYSIRLKTTRSLTYENYYCLYHQKQSLLYILILFLDVDVVVINFRDLVMLSPLFRSV